MGVQSKIVADGGYLLHTISGNVPFETFIRLALELPDTPGYEDGMPIVMDFRRFDTDGISSDELLKVARGVAAEQSWIRSGFRMALVSDTDIGFGLARMYQAHTHALPFEVGVFRSMEDAITWIGDNGAG